MQNKLGDVFGVDLLLIKSVVIVNKLYNKNYASHAPLTTLHTVASGPLYLQSVLDSVTCYHVKFT